MATEFTSSATERLVQILTAMGLPPQDAGKAAADWQQWLADEWGGDRPYIGREADAVRERSRRDRAIIADHQAGERIPLLMRKYGLSRPRIYRILEGAVSPPLP